jgi:hypothetical protein
LAKAFAFLAGFVVAFAIALPIALGAGLRILLPPLTSIRFLHVHENRLQ